jgi:hypothetical protein
VVKRNLPTAFLLLLVGLFVSGCGTNEDRVVAHVWKHPRFTKFHAAFPEAKLKVQFTGRRGWKHKGEHGQSYYTFSTDSDLAGGYKLHVHGTVVALPGGIPGMTRILTQEWCIRTPEDEEVELSRTDMGWETLDLLLESKGDLTVVNVGNIDVINRNLSPLNEMKVIDAIRKSDARIRKVHKVFPNARASVSKPRYKTRGTFQLDVDLGHDYRLVVIRTVRVASDGETATLAGHIYCGLQRGKKSRRIPEEMLDQVLDNHGDPVFVGRLWDMMASDSERVEEPLGRTGDSSTSDE